MSYEPNRLSENYASNAYKLLVPVIKKPINEMETNSLEKRLNDQKEMQNANSSVIRKSVIRKTSTR